MNYPVARNRVSYEILIIARVKGILPLTASGGIVRLRRIKPFKPDFEVATNRQKVGSAGG